MMNFSIEQIRVEADNEANLLLINHLNEKLSCRAMLDEEENLKDLLVFNEKNNTYESIINLFSEPILCKIESASKLKM